MKGDGRGEANLTNNPTYDDAPDWSPDGTKLVFRSDRNPEVFSDIYVMHANGSAQTRLTDGAEGEPFPAWSPDGTKIAFLKVLLPSVNYEIFVMNADGTGHTNLTNNGAFEARPAWQPLPTATPTMTPANTPVASPTPPPPLGGVAAYPDLPSGQNMGLVAGAIAALAVSALALGG